MKNEIDQTLEIAARCADDEERYWLRLIAGAPKSEAVQNWRDRATTAKCIGERIRSLIK